jgi:hypothetical protein
MAREIPLTQGRVAIVDDEDFERLSAHRWFFRRGYAVRNRKAGEQLLTTQIRMHCEILGIRGVDHGDGDGLNNRRSNLRPASQAKNRLNSRKRSTYGGRSPSSRFKGVVRRPSGRWRAQTTASGSAVYLGTYETEEAAAAAYNAHARARYGEFARLNEGV